MLNVYECIIDVVLNSPFDEFFPHFLSLLLIELTSSKESEQVMVIPLTSYFTTIQGSYEPPEIL